MAKSLRSKSKRRMRAIKRKKYEPKELARLEKALKNDPTSKLAESVMEVVEKPQSPVRKPANDGEEGNYRPVYCISHICEINYERKSNAY